VKKRRFENIWRNLNNPAVNVVITIVVMNEKGFGLRTVPR
jgi:glucan biosynthesis protein